MSNKITNIQTLYHGWSTISLATVRLENGATIQRLIEDHGDAATILPYDPIRKCATLVRQFRAPPFVAAGLSDVLEAIAGVIDDDDAAACARREASEEAGLKLTSLEHIATVWSTPGTSTERIHLFLASYREESKIGDGGGLPEEHENITVEERSLTDLTRMADQGVLTDMKTLVLLQTLRLRRPDLFS